MRTFLVAVVAESHEKLVQTLVSAELTNADLYTDPVDSWWVAEDDRTDRSDNDSAIFVPRGSQGDFAEAVRQLIDARTDEWDENGYPYPEDVSGAWYLPPEQRRMMWRMGVQP